jgi:hypothetical protein
VGKTVLTVWECWSCDVRLTRDEAYEVRKRTCFNPALVLRLKVGTGDPGIPGEARWPLPTQHQLRRVFGVRYRLRVEGDGRGFTVSRYQDGYPVGEMYLLRPVPQPVD